VIGELADQTPFLIRKLGARCATPRRLLALAHGRKLQGEDAAKLVLVFGVVGQKGVGAIDQNASEFEGLRGKTEACTARAKRGYKCGLLERRRLDDGASSPLMIHVFDVADQIPTTSSWSTSSSVIRTSAN